MYYKRSRSSIKGQCHSVKTSSDRQITAHVYEIGVAESNGDWRCQWINSLCACTVQNAKNKLAQRREASSRNALATDTP